MPLPLSRPALLFHVPSCRREALNLEDEAATKCSGPFRAPELYQVKRERERETERERQTETPALP